MALPKSCEALTFLLDMNDVRFDTKLYRQIVDIPIGPTCLILAAILFLFCYENIS